MKYFFTILFSLFLGLNLNAQLPPGSVAPNFALSDVDGQLHVLHDYLDEGKSVVLFVFGVYDFTSWALAEDINELNAQYGPGGTDEAIFLALETDPNTNDALTNNNSVGVPGSNPTDESWQERIDFPIINQTNSFEVDFETGSSYPYFMVVYPNRITNPASISDAQSEIEALLQEAGDNSVIPGGTNNVAGVAYLGADVVCGGTAPAFSVQNLGFANLTSFDAELALDGNTVGSTSWTGNLATFETAVIGFGLVEIPVSGTLTLTLSNPNGMQDDDLDGNVITATVSAAPNIGTDNLVINLTPDNFPEEISWSLINSGGIPIQSNGNLTAGQLNSESISFTEGGCYTLLITDTGGDGLNDLIGSLEVSAGGIELYSGTDYDDQVAISFEVQLETLIQIDILDPVVNPDGSVDFFASSSADVVQWVWNFAGGGSATGQSASNSYTQNDTYSYSVTATTDDGNSTTIGNVVVVALPPQAAFSIAQDGSNDAIVTVTDESLFTGDVEWDFDELHVSTENPANYTFTYNGGYQICLTVTNEYGSDEICQDVMVTEGFNVGVESIEQASWNLYPNPVNNRLLIEMEEEIQSIEIYNTTGQIIKNVIGSENTFNVSDLADGVYYIKIETKDGFGVKQFIKL